MRLKRVLSRLLPPRTPATTARRAPPTSRAAENGGVGKLAINGTRLSAPSATSLPHPDASHWNNGLYKYTTGATPVKDARSRHFGFSRYSIKAYTDFPGLENTVLPLHAVIERQKMASYRPDAQGTLQFLFSVAKDTLEAIPGSRDVFTQIIKDRPAQGTRSGRSARMWQGKPWNLTCQVWRHDLGHKELSKPLVRLVGPRTSLRQLDGLDTPPTGFGRGPRYLQFRIQGHLRPSCLEPGSTPVDDARAQGALPQSPSIQAVIDDLNASVFRHLMAQKEFTALSLVRQARRYLENAIKTSEFGSFIELSSLEVILSDADGQRIVTSKTYPVENAQIVAHQPFERINPSSQQMANQLDIKSRYQVSKLLPLSTSASSKVGQRSIGVAWTLVGCSTETKRPASLHEACSAIDAALSASPGSGLGCFVESMPRISDRLHLDSALGLSVHTSSLLLPIEGKSGSRTGNGFFQVRIGGPIHQSESAITAYITAVHHKLAVRLAATDTSTERPVCIVLERVLFSANPVTVWSGNLASDTGSSAAKDLEHEAQYLWSSTISILSAVSRSMVFHGYDSAREMLAEALLRKIRFPTPGLILKQVEIRTRLSDAPEVTTVVSKGRDRELPGQSHCTSSQREVNDSSTRLPETSPQNDGRSMAMQKENEELRSQRLSKLTGLDWFRLNFLVSNAMANAITRKIDEMQHGSLAALHVLYDNVDSIPDVPRGMVLTFRGPVERLENTATRNNYVYISYTRDGLKCVLPPFTGFSVKLPDTKDPEDEQTVLMIKLHASARGGELDGLPALGAIKPIMNRISEVLAMSIAGTSYSTNEALAENAARQLSRTASSILELMPVTLVEVSANTAEGNIPIRRAAAARQVGLDPPHEGPAPSTIQVSEQAAVALEHAKAPGNTLGQENSGFPHLQHPGTSSDVKPPNIAEDHDEVHESGVADSAPKDYVHASEGFLSTPVQPPMQRGVVIALGSNLGDRVAEIEKACRAIDEDPDMHIVDTSCLYETDPMYVEDQGRFVNGACEIETSLTPTQLLDRLQAIEQRQGRVKLIDKGPRNIDLDIAIFRKEAIRTDRLTVPHAEMPRREFVLRPLADLRRINNMQIPIPDLTPCAALDRLARPGSLPKGMYPLTPLLGSGQTINAEKPGRKTHVMSILNTTPDSFSDGGLNSPTNVEALKATAAHHIRCGATIIDVGGQSSRPGAPDVSADEEIERVLPAIQAIKDLPEAGEVAISVDTYRAAVAEAAVNAGAHIVNDISAGALDHNMLDTVARLGCTYVMMHMRGTPATMNNAEHCRYSKLTGEMRVELEQRVDAAIAAGIRRWRIILDPGIGFAKQQQDNLHILRTRKAGQGSTHMSRLPSLVGPSRKAFIGNITEVKEPADRIWGTAAAVTAAIKGEADIVRVHDVKEMAQVAKMADAIYRTQVKREGA